MHAQIAALIMKQKVDPRHQKRQEVVKELFAQSFTSQKNLSPIAKEILSKQKEVDPIIAESATAWPIERINKIDLAILRLATFELLQKKEPVKVIIDEAVELAKEFGSEASGAFVNGVLGAVVGEKESKDE